MLALGKSAIDDMPKQFPAVQRVHAIMNDISGMWPPGLLQPLLKA